MEIHLQCNVFIVFLMVFHVFLFILIIVLSVFSFVKEKSSILKKCISKNEEILGKTVSDFYLEEKFMDRKGEIVMNLNRDKFVKLIKDIYRNY